jgi:hypothetical protein
MAARTRTRRGDRWAQVGLAIAALGLFSPGRFEPDARAQVAPTDAPSILQPGWGEVVTVTPKWLVLRDSAGRQLPVSLTQDHVGLFVIRWPILDPTTISPRAVVEAIGIDPNLNNQIQTGVADVFEPDAQNLLGGGWPFYYKIEGGNRLATPYTGDRDNAYNGYDYIARAAATAPNTPDVAHIVAPIVGINPLRLSMGANNLYAITPLGASLSVFRVTGGSADLVAPGDTVYYVPVAAGPKTLDLLQLVVYKGRPMN